MTPSGVAGPPGAREGVDFGVARDRRGATGSDMHLGWTLTGLDCADCAAKLERSLGALSGMRRVEVSFASATLVAVFDPLLLDDREILRRVEALGYGVGGPGAGAADAAPAPGPAPSATPRTVFLAALLALAGWITGWAAVATTTGLDARVPAEALGLVSTGLYAAAIVAGGLPIARRAVGAVRLKVLDMNVLMTAAVIGAALIGEWSEGAAVVVLFALGNALEARTLERARRGLRELASLAPATARVRRDGAEHDVVIGELEVGDLVVVRPGERVPTDGTVMEGESALEEAAITGEPLPVSKRPGDQVWAGSLNGRGFLVFEATRPASDNTLARITHLIEEAQAQRAPIQQTVERFSRYYTPAVLGLAALLAIVPPVLGQPWLPSLHRALVMLVIACPCALVVSTPVSVVSALTAASRAGVLVKGGRYLEALAGVTVVAFDKTGTLTTGHPVVDLVIPLTETTEEEILTPAAAVERRAHHPVARAIVAFADSRGIPDAHAVSFESVTGQGATAEVDGRQVMVGSVEYVTRHACDLGEHADTIRVIHDAGKTPVAVAEEGVCLGLLVVSDALRPEAPGALAELRRAGAGRVVMLTGDASRAAKHVAARLPVDEVLSGLMPVEKVVAVEQLEKTHGAVVMVGDGVNDAPAMAVATVGVAMGVAGSDTALETCDVALLGDDLFGVPFMMRLARATVRRIRENVAASLLIKGVFLVLAATGQVTMWMAVFADMGTTLMVTANGMRLLAARPAGRRGGPPDGPPP